MDQKNKKLKPHPQLKQGFTLVELIIVITILAILATISFVSFQNYTKEARDSNRVTTLKTIEKGISLLETKSGYYPTPEESVEISSGNIVYVIQGIVGDNISREIKLNKTSKDPKTKNYYTYSTNLDKTRYQLGTYLENENYVYDRLINKVYAEDEMKSFYTLGSKLGIFSTNTGVIINKTNYSSGKLDLSSNENEEFIVYFSNDKGTGKYTGSGNDLVGKVIETQESDGIKSGEQTTLPITFSWEGDGNNTGFKYKDNGNYHYPKSCNDLLVSTTPNFKVGNTNPYNGTKFIEGVYYIKPDGVVSEFKVYCDMTRDDGGWTLVVRATAGNMFHRNISNVGSFTSLGQATTFKFSDELINKIPKTIYRANNDDFSANVYFDTSDNFASTRQVNNKVKPTYGGITWYGPYINGAHAGLSTYGSSQYNGQVSGDYFVYTDRGGTGSCRNGFAISPGVWCGNGANGYIFVK
ncbi:prepilin-type N-terminal cleavage/methylation domain-containing protein [Candidatus Gracilibacteria bacterium]|nr:prepilin-type N-terminal cleavage/methylation domain-containing protein [Candidatus Gracilibacteria bacterium]